MKHDDAYGNSPEDILKLIKDEDVEFIRLQFVDITGNFKNIAVTASHLEKVLENRMMFDGSSIEGYANVEQSDMYLEPDCSSFSIFPWRPQTGRVARLICSVIKPDGTPAGMDSRQILQRVLKKTTELGYSLQVAPKSEFYLFDIDEKGDPTVSGADHGGYFDVAPLDHGENVRRDLILTLEEMGMSVEASHHEESGCQHEIDLSFSDAIDSADQIATLRMAARIIARRHGKHATFMPKPRTSGKGSGLHLDFKLFKDGVNVFGDEDDPHGLSEDGYHFMGGILQHVRGMAVVTNPLVNSYKRLYAGYDAQAPIYISWSVGNRTTLLRVPKNKGGDTKLELRFPDGACNPYLTIASTLMSGLKGIQEKISPIRDVHENINILSHEKRKELGIMSMPGSLYEAINEFREDTLMEEILGQEFKNKYIRYKEREWDAFASRVSDWELEQYLGRF